MAIHQVSTMTTPSVEGLEETQKTSSSQEAEPTTKVDEQSQKTDLTKVDSSVSQASNKEDKSRLPTSYYSQRKDIRNLTNLVNMLSGKLDSFITQKPKQETPLSPTSLDSNDFWTQFQADPIGTLKKITSNGATQEQLKEIVNQAFEERSNIEKQNEYLNKQQEAEKIILSSEFAKSDSNFLDNLAKIVEENGLDYYARENPVEATKVALKLYQKEHKNEIEKPHVDSAPTKAQMRSMSTGKAQSSSSGTNEMAKQLLFQAQSNPTLFHDEDWKKKWEQAIST